MTYLNKAPYTLLALFSAILLVEVVTIFLFPDVSNYYRVLFISVVMYFVLCGKKWAKIFFIILLILGSGSLSIQLFNLYEILTVSGIPLLLVPAIIYIITILYLLFSPNAKKYFLEN